MTNWKHKIEKQYLQEFKEDAGLNNRKNTEGLYRRLRIGQVWFLVCKVEQYYLYSNNINCYNPSFYESEKDLGEFIIRIDDDTVYSVSPKIIKALIDADKVIYDYKHKIESSVQPNCYISLPEQEYKGDEITLEQIEDNIKSAKQQIIKKKKEIIKERQALRKKAKEEAERKKAEAINAAKGVQEFGNLKLIKGSHFEVKGSSDYITLKSKLIIQGNYLMAGEEDGTGTLYINQNTPLVRIHSFLLSNRISNTYVRKGKTLKQDFSKDKIIVNGVRLAKNSYKRIVEEFISPDNTMTLEEIKKLYGSLGVRKALLTQMEKIRVSGIGRDNIAIRIKTKISPINKNKCSVKIHEETKVVLWESLLDIFGRGRELYTPSNIYEQLLELGFSKNNLLECFSEYLVAEQI